MTTIAFIGLGNMGNPMAANLVKAGHAVQGFDLQPENLSMARDNGVVAEADAAAAVQGADVVITMLPAGKHVLSVYEEIGAGGLKGHAVHRLLHHRRRFGAPGPRHRGQSWHAVDRRACVGRHRRRYSRHADLHGRRLGRSLRQGRAGPEADGRQDRALRRSRSGPGSQDLQQHDPRHFDDRRRRSLRARRKTRPVAPGAVRRRLDLFRAVLVADHLLPCARSGSDLAGQP